MNASCHTRISHVTHISEPCHTWIRHVTHEYVMSHIHVACPKESRVLEEWLWDMSDVCVTCGSRVLEERLWDMSHVCVTWWSMSHKQDWSMCDMTYSCVTALAYMCDMTKEWHYTRLMSLELKGPREVTWLNNKILYVTWLPGPGGIRYVFSITRRQMNCLLLFFWVFIGFFWVFTCFFCIYTWVFWVFRSLLRSP